jgi:PAS domain S-box-containing protein
MKQAVETGEVQMYEQQIQFSHTVQYEEVRVVPCSSNTVLLVIRNISDRKRAEEALRQSETRLQQLAAASPAIIYSIEEYPGRPVRFEYLSPAFEDIHEIPMAEVLQNAAITFDTFHPDDREGHQQAVIRCVETMQPFKHEWRIITPSGKIKWIQANSRPERRENGMLLWHGVVIDITDLKQAEEALRQQAKREQLLRTITQRIRQSLNLEEILATAVSEVRQTLQVDRVIVFHLTSETSGTVLKESVVPEHSAIATTSWKDECFSHDFYEYYRQGKSRIVPDAATDEWATCLAEYIQKLGVKSKVVTPIIQCSENNSTYIWGLLIVHACSGYRQWHPPEVELLQQIANQLSIAIQQANLYQQVQTELAERKRIEEALRQSEARFRSYFELPLVGIAITSPKKEWLTVNHKLCEMLGYSSQEFSQCTWADLTHPEDLNLDLQCFDQMMAGEINQYSIDKRYIRKDGSTIYTNLGVGCVREPNGKVDFIVAIIQDITEKQAIDRMKDEFISIVSHELRTPLTAIRGSLGILETGVLNNRPEKAKHMLQVALNNSDRLVRLVNDILELERLSSGKAPLVMEACYAEDLMRRAMESVQPIADQASIHLSLTPTTVQVQAAADLIVQTLTNLLSNAIKFSPVGKTVWLSAEMVNESLSINDVENKQLSITPNRFPITNSRLPVTHSSSLNSQFPIPPVLFKIKDQGRGIPSDKLETIFGRFQQVDVSDARQKGGTGLGLAICQNIVQQHGGHIWVESTLGEGSTFYFTLSAFGKASMQ